MRSGRPRPRAPRSTSDRPLDLNLTSTETMTCMEACTLDARDLARRKDEWDALRREGLIEARDGESIWKMDVAERLAELVRAERICCSHLRWELEQRGDALVLRVV